MTARNVKLNKFIKYLLTFNKSKYRLNIPQNVMCSLSQKTYDIMNNEPNVLELKAPLYIVGDIHGQYEDLLRILKITELPPKNNYLFLGDYVDRGDNSIEVLSLLFSLKIKFPDNIFMIRGNHECASVNKNYGFYQECMERYNQDGKYVWDIINKTLANLPLAATVNDNIFCVHGGISPELDNIEQINSIPRGITIPDKGLLCDITWADPSNHNSEWQHSDRGVSYTFNTKALNTFLDNNNIDLLVRAHQVVDNGYEFFANKRLVTVFSAPNYCNECGNSAAVLKINSNLECSFVILEPISTPIHKRNPKDIYEKKELGY